MCFANELSLVKSFVSRLSTDHSPWGTVQVATEFYYQRGRTDIVAYTADESVIAVEAKLKDWRTAINSVLQHEWEGPPIEGPVAVRLDFQLLRPASVSVKKRPLPTVKPDLDKLIRAAWDAMTGICFKDDAQAVISIATKHYAEESGLKIEVEPVMLTEVEG